MEELFNTQLPGGERPDIQLCIFPHLKEFLVIDLREGSSGILLLDAAEVFTDEFFTAVEAEFSETVRAETEFPFAHLINLPLRMEETIRETAMTFVLDQLGVGPHNEAIPNVIVFIVSGGALGAQSEVVLEGLKQLLRANCGETTAAEWEAVLSRLITEENTVLQRLNQEELTEALRGDSPDYFTLWENRN
jgi:hypothetical protein